MTTASNASTSGKALWAPTNHIENHQLYPRTLITVTFYVSPQKMFVETSDAKCLSNKISVTILLHLGRLKKSSCVAVTDEYKPFVAVVKCR